MTTNPIELDPKIVAGLVRAGQAVLIDVREPDEFARQHIKGARSAPLSRLEGAPEPPAQGQLNIYMCRSGMRTQANCARLQSVMGGDVHTLKGGLDAWSAAGLPVETDVRAPLEIMRQVQIAAGGLVLLGVVLGLTASPLFFGLSAFVGAGLTFAGVTGFCGMARLLGAMPWNRRAAA